ncbi:MAG: hypothetical protein CL927_19650 [Deltaproteobacteria bacterium]|nr:hypothetical protein [Deltaproteobacteria bacterium]HCH62099.1 hypothetical protein [Deltaproteobacteria bacterium]
MKQHLIVLLAAVFVLALGYGGYFLMFQEAEYRRLTVTSVAGEVTRLDSTGAAVPAGPGDAVEETNVIRVGATGRAVLTAGEGTQLLLEQETSVRVLSASRRGVQVELDEGRVKARVKPGSRVLGVRAGERVAQTAAGGFQVARDVDGFVRVAVDAGTVEMDGPDGPQALAAGQRLDVDPSGEAVISSAVLEEILLEVQWPETPAGAAPLPIEGSTVPFGQVQVRGPQGTTTVHANQAGHFASEVSIPQGEHTITIDVSDGLGQATSDTRSVHRPSTVPVASTEVKFGG